MSSRSRVLLLEDDPQIRRFVSLVLSQLDLELVECASVSTALQALEQAPVDVALCDLMLAGESGFALIERMAGSPAWRGARVVVFSAAIDGAERARMESLGVWGQLSKPTSVAELMRCVQEALSAQPSRPPSVSAVPPLSNGEQPGLPSVTDEQAAIAQFFEGDAALFRAYRDGCRAQFPIDLACGDEACARADLPGLCRLAHSLKTVVGSLGASALAAGFAELEAFSRQLRLEDARQQWQALRGFLLLLARSGDQRQD